MEAQPPFWLMRLLLVACCVLAVTVQADVASDRLIKRSKRSLEDEVVGDALYDVELVKREEIPIPKETSENEEAEDAEPSSQAKAVGSASVPAAKRHLHQEKLTSAQNDVVMVKDEQTQRAEKAEENASLRSGMHSNIDHPFTDSGLTKQYRPEDDVDNGEMMSASDEQRRRDLVTRKTDSLANEEQQLLTETNDVLKLVENERHKKDSLTKRNTIVGSLGSLLSKTRTGRAKRESEHAVADTHDMQDGGAPSHFQVDDKSADLEINANSAGVKVKAKPASLQVVSRPGTHGGGGHGSGHHEMEMFHEPMMHYHHPHHHRHHHGHHHGHRRHHRPHHYDYDDYEEEHHETPHFFDVPHYGSTWGHGYGGGGGEGGGEGGFGGGGDIGFEHAGYGRSLLGRGMREPTPLPLERPGYGRSLLSELPSPYLPVRNEDVNGYGRSSIESVLSAASRLGGGVGASSSASLNLPDSELLLMERLRARLVEDRAKERLRQEQENEIRDSSSLVDRIRNLESRYRDDNLPERRSSPLHPDRLSSLRSTSREDDLLGFDDNLLGRKNAHYHSSSRSRNREPFRGLDDRSEEVNFKKRDHFTGRRHGRHGGASRGIHYR